MVVFLVERVGRFGVVLSIFFLGWGILRGEEGSSEGPVLTEEQQQRREHQKIVYFEAEKDGEEREILFSPAFSQRLDSLHESLALKLQGGVETIDNLFIDDPQVAPPIPNSFFMLGFDLELEYDDGLGIKFDPNVKADIRLPNLERKLRLFIENQEVGELPGSDPTETDNPLVIGLRRSRESGFFKDFHTSAGVKWRWPPELFSEVKWYRNYPVGDWLITPSQSVFWFSDDGAGEITSLWISRPIWGDWIGRSVTAAKWTEESKGLEWEQSLQIGYTEYYDQLRLRRSYGARASVFGHKRGSGVVDRYRLGLFLRRPLYKRWLYWQVTPEIEWENDNDWDWVPSIRFTLDAYFRGRDS